MFITHRKGKIAQLKVELRAAEKGVRVSIPTIDSKYDAILDDGKKLYRVQIKYGNKRATKHSFAVKTASHEKPYKRKEIDAILVYVPVIDKILWLNPNLFVKRSELSFQTELSPFKHCKYSRLCDRFIW